MVWLPDGEKFLKMYLCEDVFIRFDRIHESDGQTGGQLDGHRTTA